MPLCLFSMPGGDWRSGPWTGIHSVIRISTGIASYGPRVEYFFQSGPGQTSISVSLDESQAVVEASIPLERLAAMVPLVIERVLVNRFELLDFWANGTAWTDPQVTLFKASLRAVSAYISR